MSVSQDTSVQAQIGVDAPIERAFAVFPADSGRWFPNASTLLRADLPERVLRPPGGGRVDAPPAGGEAGGGAGAGRGFGKQRNPSPVAAAGDGGGARHAVFAEGLGNL